MDSETRRGLDYVEAVLHYFSKKAPHLDKKETIKFFQALPQSENPAIKEVAMTLAEQWKEEGREEEGRRKDAIIAEKDQELMAQGQELMSQGQELMKKDEKLDQIQAEMERLTLLLQEKES